ncbi:MAG: T9SS type A sorting domain-containing protein [Lentimicrobiaceae bacterium]|nr:T9SS type A sorting domain-containing protein [Lentimicrobiaceae bacterium]
MLQIIALIIFMLTSLVSVSQHQNILIGEDVYPEEPTIFIDPGNTNRIIAGANIDNVYFSDDGGYSWDQSTLQSASFGIWGDPCVIVDTEGYLYYFHLSWPPEGEWIDRIVCQRSTDDAQSWNDGAGIGLVLGKVQDKEWAVVDRTNNNLYVTWTQFDDYGSSYFADSTIIRFSKSTDQGLTWMQPKRLSQVAGNCVDDDLTVEGAVPCIGPNGEIYVAWSGPAGIVFDRSLDEGETWLEEDIFISEHPGGWAYDIPGISQCNGMPVTACDISGGPYHGTLYVNWSDQRNGEDDTDVWLSKSTDGGNTWTPAVRVNDDPPGRQQFFTWMTIDQTTGILYFVFYDRRNYTNNLTDVYMAMSDDSGETFLNFKVSETPFLPASSIFFGDYTNISAHDGVVRPIWTRLHQGELSIWTAIIDLNWVGEEKPEIMPFALDQNYPNPYEGSTYISFKLFQPSRITIRVFDTMGKVVATLINNKSFPQGKYIEHFDPVTAGIRPGIYYFSLTSNSVMMNRKMIYIQ